MLRNKEKFLVQCKLKVGVQVLRELYGVMAAQGAAGGFVVTSGFLTEKAMASASGRNVHLVDGPKLFGLIQQARAVGTGQGKTTESPAETVSAPAVPAAILCPRCSSVMVRRVAKYGSSAGKAFWGCGDYPNCKATRPVEPD